MRLSLGAPALLLSCALVACGKPSAQTTPPGTVGLFTDPEDSAHPKGEAPKAKKYELDARGKELLARVKEGDEADVMRFAAYVGAAGLIELSHDEATRALALAAMEHTPGYSCAALLADVARDGSDDDARLALGSLHGLAARRRLAVDVEDTAELGYACETLVTLAKDPSRKERSERATSVLRMLSEQGCDAGALAPAPGAPNVPVVPPPAASAASVPTAGPAAPAPNPSGAPR